MDELQKFNKNLIKLFNSNTYWKKYGIDVIITTCICLFFLSIITYFIILNLVIPIKKDWTKYKCNPLVVPIAGYIKKSDDKTAFEYTSSNFYGCTQTILQNITKYAVEPINYLMSALNTKFMNLNNVASSLRGQFNNMRSSMGTASASVQNKLMFFVVPFTKFFINLKDIFQKATGLIVTVYYTFISAFMTLQSFFKVVIELIIKILLVLAGLIIFGWILSAVLASIPFVGAALAAPVIATAIANTIVMIMIMIPTVIIILFMKQVLESSTSDVPSVPSCFSGNTVIKLQDNKTKLFKNLKLGDVLNDGSYITTIMKLSSHNQKIYKLNNILVTGNHRIYHEHFGLIPVSEHPESIYIENFRDMYIYCINTSSKNIVIDGYIFTDWDDIDNNDIIDLHINCSNKGILPHNFNKKDINTYLNNGFHEDTKIDLDDGRSLSIKDIEVNDVLRFGEKVIGVIQIDATRINGVYEYYLDNKVILKCSKNIEINNNLGNINTNTLEGNEILHVSTLYHLLTDKKSFYINGINVQDYNSGIEKYLREGSYGNSYLTKI